MGLPASLDGSRVTPLHAHLARSLANLLDEEEAHILTWRHMVRRRLAALTEALRPLLVEVGVYDDFGSWCPECWHKARGDSPGPLVSRRGVCSGRNCNVEIGPIDRTEGDV